jgi:hypothetical protein
MCVLSECPAVAGEDDALEWMFQEKRRGARRILVVGVLVLVPSIVWLVSYFNSAVGASPFTYVRVVGGLAVAIGSSLTIAGAILFTRVRRAV